jgi:hypothetical protein
MPPTQKVAGRDLIVFMEADHDSAPKELVMDDRMTVKHVKSIIGVGSTAFLVNKNLQRYAFRVAGALIWIPFMAIIATVIQVQDVSAWVSVMYPISRKDEIILIADTRRIKGQYIQYMTGPNPNGGTMNGKLRTRKDGETLEDRNGCIKMSIEGGDILRVKASVLKKAKRIKHCSNSRPISRPGRTSRKLKGDAKVNVVDVVYIYAANPEVFKFVETYQERNAKGKIEHKPVFKVPIGNQYNKHDR